MKRAAWIPLGLVLSIVCLSAGLRVAMTFGDPAFDVHDPVGIVKSDPALILYVTERIVEAGGGLPDDFRADPRIEHPELVDIPAMFTVGQEFLVAWAQLATGQAYPLHAVAVVVMSIVTSLTALGVFGLAREISGDARAGVLAALLWGVMRASYRTVGFVIVREDLAIPLFALHLFALARALRSDSAFAWGASAVLLAGALATWHAMGFVVALEFGLLLAAAFVSGRQPFARTRPWIFPAILLGFCLVIPVLSTKLFVLSPAMALVAALGTAGIVTRWQPAEAAGPRAAAPIAAAAVALLLVVGLSRWLGTSDYAHVFELMLAKLRYLGQLPDDPSTLSFGARLLWQGPFATAHLPDFVDRMGLPLLALPAALLWRDRRPELAVLWLGAAMATGLAIVVVRLSILPAVLLPVLTAALVARPPAALRQGRWASGLLAALVLGQTLWFAASMARHDGTWNVPGQTSEMRAALGFIRERVPEDAAIAADFINSAAILADSRHPVVMQPKYETRRSRDRVETFVNGLYHSSPEEFSRLLAEEFQARYLLLDWYTLWRWRYKAGLPLSAQNTPRGSAAERLIHLQPERYMGVPGFELVYVSPERFLRLYRIDPPPPLAPGGRGGAGAR